MKKCNVYAVFISVVMLCVISCATYPSRSEIIRMAYNNGDIYTLAIYDEWDKVLELLQMERFRNLDEINVTKRFYDSTVSSIFTPLMDAAKQGRFDVVQALVERGANINLRVTRANSQYLGKTASDLAYDAGHFEIVDYLKAWGEFDF